MKKIQIGSIALISVGVITFLAYSYVGNIRQGQDVVHPAVGKDTTPSNQSGSSSPIVFQPALVDVPFVRQNIDIKPEIAKNFSLSEVKNIPDMERAYGFTFSKEELLQLEKNKFVIKNILDTNVSGKDGLPVYENNREVAALYQKVIGSYDYKERTQANAVFISADSMMNLFSILSADLLKETENKYLFDQTLSITKVMYDQASLKLHKATTADDRTMWLKVRNYFAVPYALLSTAIKPINANDYWESDYRAKGLSVEDMQSDYAAKDKAVDAYGNATTFVKTLGLGDENQSAVLADLKKIYDAEESRGIPTIFESEFKALSSRKIEVAVPFTLFKPRGTYTSSSLRRQYFRAVQWYQQIPFLLSSKDLTTYAVGIGGLIKSDANIQKQFASYSSLIAFIVGESDDLDVSDYAAAVDALGVNANDVSVLGKYLNARKPQSKIKSLPVLIDPNANVTVEDEMLAIRGMRFMSQKFIPDSYWTGALTQGDEAPAVNGMRLPSDASSLEVMSMLGSPYATSHLSDLPFYAEYKKAIDTKLALLKDESRGWNTDYWKSNLYTSTLWTVSGLFSWLDEHRSSVPQFMQSTLWDAKTLLTASSFWTELRHTSLLYAKQSFAEKGGGGDDECDTRLVPEPAKGYVEPQAEAYDRLLYVAQRLAAEYKARGFELQNITKLESYVRLLNTVREYTKLELENTLFSEPIITKTRLLTWGDKKTCVENMIAPEASVKQEGSYYSSVSRWEELRTGIANELRTILPTPVEGPILKIKDKRVAVVADIHTNKDGKILEEGTGVPRIMFVAVKDINGPRLTVGFTYSQYEFMSNSRMTDEEWQNSFYFDSGDDVITYKPKNVWPDVNVWFKNILGSK